MADEWVVAIIGGGTVNFARSTEWLDSWLPAEDLTIYVPLDTKLAPSAVVTWFKNVHQDFTEVSISKITLLLVQAKLAGKTTYLVLYDDKPQHSEIADLYSAAVLAGIEVRNLGKAGMPFSQMPLDGAESHADGLEGASGYPDEGTGDDLVRKALSDAVRSVDEAAEHVRIAMEYFKENHMPGAFAAEAPIRSESVKPLAEIQEKKKYWLNSAGTIRVAGKGQPKGKEKEIYLTDDEAALSSKEDLRSHWAE